MFMNAFNVPQSIINNNFNIKSNGKECIKFFEF